MNHSSNGDVGERPIYFFGCDMGGWQNTEHNKGDALAVFKWINGKCIHVEATANVQFFPILGEGILAKHLQSAIESDARIIVAIDGALGWPLDFRSLVKKSITDIQYDVRVFSSAINNPYLYRETERFIRSYIRTKCDPLTAPGDKFGNNSSKAQMLAAWFKSKLQDAYLPPFDEWSFERAKKSIHTIIEVYPDASRQSKLFLNLKWPTFEEKMQIAGNKDIIDARICAMTAFCYANHVTMIDGGDGIPPICTPDDDRLASYKVENISHEGWIFTPQISHSEEYDN